MECTFLDSLFPEFCVVCGRWIDPSLRSGPFPLCTSCRSSLDRGEPRRCRICSRELVSEQELCMECRSRSFAFLTNYSLFPYRGVIQECILSYKSKGMIRLSRFFAEELAPLLKERYPGLAVVPVPSRKEAMKKRGFDPLDRICKELHAHCGIRILPLLSRKWGTKEQKTLNKQERIVNLKTAFYFIPSMQKNEHHRIPGSVVLLDDVFTTGTTLKACAEILQHEGVQDVYGVTIARD